MDQITMLVTNIRTMYGTQGNYVGLNARQAVKLGIVPAVMIGDGHDKGDTIGETTAAADSQTLTNPFKGDVEIATTEVSTSQDNDAATGFRLTYKDLPKEACIALATADFGSGAGSGFIGAKIGASGQPSGTYGTNEGKAYDMPTAITNCTENAQITWYFY